MNESVGRISVSMFAVCLLVGVLLYSAHRPTHAQQRAVRAETTVLARGVLESARYVEIRSEVPGQAKIISIVPEGSKVKKGDLLIELDDSELEEQVIEQQIAVAQARAKLAQAEAELQTLQKDGKAQVRLAEGFLDLAKLEKDRVLGDGGELATELAVVDSEIAVATARLKAAEVLLARAQADPTAAEELRLRVTEASESLKVAKVRKRLLEEAEKKQKSVACDLAIAERQVELDRRIDHLRRATNAAKANVAAQEAAAQLAQRRLDRAMQPIKNCKIYAPQDGVAMYGGGGSSRIGQVVLREGATVRERQTLIRLPDFSRLQVRVSVEEADINIVRVGQPTEITVDAFPDRTFQGKVTAVSEVPERSPRSADHIKRFKVIVSFDDAPERVVLGLTATVKLHTGPEKPN